MVDFKTYCKLNEMPYIHVGNRDWDTTLEAYHDFSQVQDYFRKLMTGQVVTNSRGEPFQLKDDKEKEEFVQDLFYGDMSANTIKYVVMRHGHHINPSIPQNPKTTKDLPAGSVDIVAQWVRELEA